MRGEETVEGWGVTVRSHEGLYGRGTLLVGDGWIQLEASTVDPERHAGAKRVRLWLFGVAAVLVVGGLLDSENAAAFILLAFVVAAIGVVWAAPGWHLGEKGRVRWAIEQLEDVTMSDDSGGRLLGVLLFGWLGLLLGGLTPQRSLRFSVPDDEHGYVDYAIDVGSSTQFVEIAAKLRSLEGGQAVSIR